jgi:hypothetical protein
MATQGSARIDLRQSGLRHPPHRQDAAVLAPSSGETDDAIKVEVADSAPRTPAGIASRNGS